MTVLTQLRKIKKYPMVKSCLESAYNAGLERAACLAAQDTMGVVTLEAIRKEINNGLYRMR
jgi:hypothetical protein